MKYNKLYFISKNIYYGQEDIDFYKNIKIFVNLKDALDELNKISKILSNFKYNDFCIRSLIYKDNKYIQTHETYYHQKGYS